MVSHNVICIMRLAQEPAASQGRRMQYFGPNKEHRTQHRAGRERCRVLILSDGGHITLGREAYQSWARILESLFPQLQLCCLQLTPSPSLPPCFRHRAGLAGSTGFVVRAGSEEGNVLVANSEQLFWGRGTLAEMCLKDGHGERMTAPASRKTS